MLFRINAQSEVYEAALADVGVPYVLKGGERFFERPEVREAVLLLRGAAAGGSDPGALVPDRSATCWPRPAGRSTGRRAGGAARDRWQSLAALVDLAVDLVAEHADAGPRRASSGTWPSGPTPSTRRPCRASRSPRCTRPRAWSGTPSSWSAWSTASCRSPSRCRRPEAVEEERRLLYVGVTRAREQLTLSWSLARNPGRQAGPAAEPLPHRPRAGVLGRTRPAARRPGKKQKVVLEGEAGRAVRAAAGLAEPGGPVGLGAGVRRVHRRHAAGDRRDPAGEPA